MASSNPYTSFGKTTTAPASGAPSSGHAFEASTFGHPSAPDTHPANAKAASTAPPDAGAAGLGGSTASGKPHGDTLGNLKAGAVDVGNKAKSIVGSVWGHLSTGHATVHTAVGKLQNYRLLTPGSAQTFWREEFQPPASEVLKNYYACHLSTTTGPVPGSLFVATHSFSFMSDRPLTYNTGPASTAWSFYKVTLPLDKVADVVVPPGSEKYIQVNTTDGHQFWFMGFISFDRAVQELRETRAVRPQPAATEGFYGGGSPYSAPQYQPQATSPYTQPPPPPIYQGPYAQGSPQSPPPGPSQGTQGQAPPGPYQGTQGQAPPGPYQGSQGQAPPGPYQGTQGQPPPGPYQGTPGPYGQAPSPPQGPK